MFEPHYVALGDSDVHYWRSGTGSPVLVLCPVPYSARSVLDLLEPLASGSTVFVMDLAGFGQSDPLDPSVVEIPAHAERVREFADLLGLDRPAVVAIGDSGAVAIELAASMVGLRGVVVLGVEALVDPSRSTSAGLGELVVDAHGAHLVTAWHRVRDSFLLRESDVGVVTRRPTPPPALEQLHQLTFDQLTAGAEVYRYARALAARDGDIAMTELEIPCVLIVRPGEEHVAPTLVTQLGEQAVRVLANGQDPSLVIQQVVMPMLSGGSVPVHETAPHSGGTSRRYIRTPEGMSHVRMDGDPDAPPLLVLHASPGSAESFSALIADLATDHLVIAPDTMGNGWSSGSLTAGAEIADFAQVTAGVLDELGVRQAKVYGNHTGACIAVELAVRRPDLVGGLLADGLATFDAAFQADLAAHYFIDMRPDVNAAHLQRAWHAFRDVVLFWPWYRQTLEGIRASVPPEPAVMHRFAMDFIRSGASYRHSYAAAFRYPSAARLAQVTVPTLTTTSPTDPLREGTLAAAVAAGFTFVGQDPAAGLDVATLLRRHLIVDVGPT